MNFKRIMSLALAALMLCGALAACTPKVDNSPAHYKVQVIGVDGKPMTTGVAVKFMQDGVQKAMQTVDAGGVASKELPKGDYQVELMFTVAGASYTYQKTDLNLSATKTELSIELFNTISGDPRKLNVKTSVNELGMPQTELFDAYDVKTGKTVVKLTEGKRTFFVFAPTEAGIYEVYFEGDIKALGYFGSPSVVLDINVGKPVEGKENSVRLEIMPSMIGSGETGTAELVLGIDAADGTTEGVLNIVRAGDYVDPAPAWIVYENTAKPETAYKLPAGATVKNFDLTKSYEIVFNEADGTYHVGTADGPLVLVRTGKNADKDAPYLPSFETVCETSVPVTYQYNENKEIIKRVNYGPMIVEYFEVDDDASGLCPLTKDLYTMIREVGTYKGWWDSSSHDYLFYDETTGNQLTIHEESGWLFNCCYIEG